jgi:hypothetical protein
MDLKRPGTTRFKTKLRGQEVDIEIGIRSMSPTEFEVIFHGMLPSGGPLNRQELATLAREASRISAAHSKDSTH